mmetsp:Transcript_65211/g.160584  ORF Transcript_65211/g.160584 Transcript_65211/m.160584 type:complete len:209 (-) Transcript_65211:348-974(-)
MALEGRGGRAPAEGWRYAWRKGLLTDRSRLLYSLFLSSSCRSGSIWSGRLRSIFHSRSAKRRRRRDSSSSRKGLGTRSCCTRRVISISCSATAPCRPSSGPLMKEPAGMCRAFVLILSSRSLSIPPTLSFSSITPDRRLLTSDMLDPSARMREALRSISSLCFVTDEPRSSIPRVRSCMRCTQPSISLLCITFSSSSVMRSCICCIFS